MIGELSTNSGVWLLDFEAKANIYNKKRVFFAIDTRFFTWFDNQIRREPAQAASPGPTKSPLFRLLSGISCPDQE